MKSISRHFSLRWRPGGFSSLQWPSDSTLRSHEEDIRKRVRQGNTITNKMEEDK